MDLRRELEFARALRHANVLRMERLYVDVVEESLWIGMELLDRSLADVLAVVGEDAGAGWLSDSEWANSEVQEGAETGVVEISERMVARFVWDVSDTLSNSPQISHLLGLLTDWLIDGGWVRRMCVGPPGFVLHPRTPHCASGRALG